MADTYGPFASLPWGEAEWYRFAALWTPDGVLTSADLPMTTSGLTLTLGTGRAWVRGAGYERTSSTGGIAVAVNTNSSLARRDRLVLRRSLATHDVTPRVIQGTPASTPVDPALTQTDTDWDVPLYSFQVPPASGTTISAVADQRVVVASRALFVQSTAPAYAPDGAVWLQV